MSEESQPDYKDRTFAITASKDIRADDVNIKADTQVAVVTSAVNVRVLLGLIQFHGFRVDEVTDQVDSQGEEIADESGKVAPVPVVSQEENTSPADESSEQPTVDSDANPEAVDSIVKQFIADGMDEKTASILAEQNLTPEAIKEFVAADFDLTELDGIGETRATKILQVYPKAS